MKNKTPKIIDLEKIGSPQQGYITIVENQKNIPFEIKRVYWTYYTPQDVIRGGHAHFELEQIIIAVSGKIIFNVEDKLGNKNTFVLEHPSQGFYIPKLVWRDIQFSHNAVLLCLASLEYNEADYIRDYESFKKYCK